MKNALLSALVAIVFLGGCGGARHNDPLTEALVEQKSFEKNGDTIEHRKEAREVAIGHLKKYLSDWTVEGAEIYGYPQSSLYYVGVDCVSGDKRQTVVIRVSLFAKNDGG